MAFESKWIDRYKAEGFFKHVEWNAAKGVLIRVYDKEAGVPHTRVTFETGTFDIEYDQNMPGFRQFFLARKDAVKFMLNMGLNTSQVIEVFQRLNSVDPVTRFI